MKFIPLIVVFFTVILANVVNASETRHVFSISCSNFDFNIVAIDVIKEECYSKNEASVGKSTVSKDLSGMIVNLSAIGGGGYAFYWGGSLITGPFPGDADVISVCAGGITLVPCNFYVAFTSGAATEIYPGETYLRWGYSGNMNGFNDVNNAEVIRSVEFNLVHERKLRSSGIFKSSIVFEGFYFSEIDSANSQLDISKDRISADGSDSTVITLLPKDVNGKDVSCWTCYLDVSSTKGSISESGLYLGGGPSPYSATLVSDTEPGTALVSASWNGGTFDVTRSVAFVDNTPPVLVSSTPSDNSTAASISDDIVLTFSEDVVAGTGNIEVSSGVSDTRSVAIGDAQVSIAANEVTINLDSNFDYSTGYSIQLASGVIVDTAGNAYAGITDATTLNFTIAAAPDVTAPLLTLTSPSDNASDVSLNDNIVLTFSENIVAGTGLVTLFKADGTSIQAFDIASLPSGSSIAGNTLTINPTSDLDSSTGYYFQVATTAIDDAVGNSFAGIADATTLSFTTVDVTEPTVNSVVVPADGSYSASDSLSFVLSTSENVFVAGSPQIALTIGSMTRHATYASGSGTSALVFSYVVQADELDADGISVGALEANGGTLRDSAGNNMVLTLNSVGTTTGVLVDAIAPTVTSVSAPSNDTYQADETLSLTVNTSEAVTVNTTGGTPQIALTVGGTTRRATYVSGSGTSALVFSYDVQAGEVDADGISVGALEANGGTLRDSAGNNLNLTLNSVGATTDVLVDAVAPTVTSVSVPASGTYLAGGILSFTVNTSEAVTVNTTGGTPQIALTVGGTTRQATYVSGSGTSALVFSYDVQAGEIDTEGIAVASLINANSGTLRDAAGNNMVLTLNSVGTTTGVLVDAVAPTVTSVSVPANGTYLAGETLSFNLNTSEAITINTGSGTPQIALSIGGTTRQATYTSGSGTSALVFSYNVQAGEIDTDGIAVASSINTNSGTLQDAAGNNLNLTLNSVGATTAVLVGHGSATQLVITNSAVAAANGEQLATQPALAIRDANGNLVTSDSSTQITISIASGTGGRLGGTTTVTAVRGVVTFTDVTLAGLTTETYTLSFVDTADPAAFTAVTSTVALTGPTAATVTTTPITTSDPVVVFSGSAEANSTVAILVDGVEEASVTADGTGAWSYTFSADDLVIGDNSITVIVTDAGGNRSAASTPVVITLEAPAELPEIALPEIGLPEIVGPVDLVIRGKRIVSGTLMNPIIGATGVVSGGTLCGVIINEGIIRDTALCAGASVMGGALQGTIAGDPAAPAQLNARVASGAVLSSVIVSSDAVLEPEVVFGDNVSLASLDNVPAGTDLTSLGLRENGQLDLNSVLLSSDIPADQNKTLIERIREFDEIQSISASANQEPISAALQIVQAGLATRVMPVRVSKAPANLERGIHYDADGNIRMILEGQIEVLAYPLFRLEDKIMEAVTGYDSALAMELNGKGDFVIANIAGDLPGADSYTGRAAVTSQQVGEQTPLGWQFKPSAYLRNVESVSYVSRDVAGAEPSTKFEQTLVPRPREWSLFRASLENDPRVSEVKISIDGLIQITYRGELLCAMADHRVEANAATSNPNRGLVFVPATDKNADDAEDYFVYYPDGSRQLIYLLPTQESAGLCGL